jgi:two-component system phosphate regulon sensor histidine kinase PhoR
MIVADEFHFRNILFNLIDNSIKYCDKSPQIKIKLIQKNRLHLIIEDNGPGIPHKYKNLIFKKFGRIPTGDLHNVKGFGLGLFYVHQLIKAHKWKIILDKNYQKGTRFIITIRKQKCNE